MLAGGGMRGFWGTHEAPELSVLSAGGVCLIDTGLIGRDDVKPNQWAPVSVPIEIAPLQRTQIVASVFSNGLQWWYRVLGNNVAIQ